MTKEQEESMLERRRQVYDAVSRMLDVVAESERIYKEEQKYVKAFMPVIEHIKKNSKVLRGYFK